MLCKHSKVHVCADLDVLACHSVVWLLSAFGSLRIFIEFDEYSSLFIWPLFAPESLQLTFLSEQYSSLLI